MTQKRIVTKSKNGRFFVGSVGVDSGQIFITDPCYIKHSKELYDESKWQEFCDARFPNRTTKPAVEMMGGVCTSTNFGDGEYPVYVTLDADGIPKKIEVIFTRMTSDRDEEKEIEYEEVEN